MKNFKKQIALLAALACAGTMLAGCNSDNNDDGGSNDGGNTPAADGGNTGGDSAGGADVLTILSWTDADLKHMIPVFCEKYGYSESQIKYIQQGTSGGEASEQYQQYLDDVNANGGEIDILMLESDWILKYLNGTYTLPLADVGITEADYANAYKYTVDIGKDEEGVLRGGAYQAAPGGYVYRADLAETYLGVKTPDEMQAKVSDWAKFEETAAAVKEASGGKTAMVATLGDMWQVYSYNRANPWVVDNKLNLADSEGYYDVAKRFYDNGYVTDVSQWEDSWYAIGQDDTAMGYFFSTWCLGKGAQLEMAEGGEGGPTYGKYNICVGPTEYAWGGTWFAVSNHCDSKDMAAEWIKCFTCDAEGMEAYALASGDYANNKVAMKKIVDEGTNSNDRLGGQDQFAVFLDVAEGIDLTGKITRYDSTIKNNFNDTVKAYATGATATKEEAIESFQNKVAEALPGLAWD